MNCVEVIGTGDNVGFAYAVNRCIEFARTYSPTYIWMVNNDAIVENGCLAHLVAEMRDHRDTGLISPTIMNAYTGDTWFAGGVVDTRTWVTRHDAVEATGAKYITGCAMFVRMRVLEEIGLMDESYWMYYEDVDLSIRASRRGWHLRVSSVAKAHHRISMGSDGDGDFMRYWYARNSILISKKFGTYGSVLSVVFLQAKRSLTNSISHFVLGRPRPWKGQLRGTIAGCMTIPWHAPVPGDLSTEQFEA